MEPLDQRLGAAVGLGIEPLAGMAVAAEETLEPKHIAVSGAADDYRSASSRLEQPNATQYQGAHDPLAQLRLGDQ